MSSGAAKPSLNGSARIAKGNTRIASKAEIPQVKLSLLILLSLVPKLISRKAKGVSIKKPKAAIPCSKIFSTVNTPTKAKHMLLAISRTAPARISLSLSKLKYRPNENSRLRAPPSHMAPLNSRA